MELRPGSLESVAMTDEVNRFWHQRPVLVTGCTGLLGSWLTRELVRRGADVIGLIRDQVPESDLYRSGVAERIKMVRGTIQDLEVLERVLGEYEVQTVFHLAAQTIVGVANRNPLVTFEANVRGTWLVLEACRRSPTVGQIIVASSDKAYGIHEQLPYSEDCPLQGRFPYDVSKSCADLIAQSYAATFRLPVAVTRCGNLFGGGDLNWNRIVPGTIRSGLAGERPIIRSNGKCIRDYFYVEDAVLAYLALAEQIATRPELIGQAFNFSNEIQVSVLDIVRHILGAVGRDDLEPDVRDEAQHEIPHQYMDASKARRLLNWRPHFRLQEGLEKTVAWYRAFLSSDSTTKPMTRA